jgi:small multidrug resistance pump
MTVYLLLALAIASEVIGTLSLRASEGFTRPLPSALVALGYGGAFYLLSLVLKDLPLGTTYAIWAGVGTALVALGGALVFGDRLNWAAVGGIALILAGLVVLNLSGAARH